MNFNNNIKEISQVKVPNLMVLCKHYFQYLIQVKNLTLKSFQICLKATLDIYYCKLGIGAASRVTKQPQILDLRKLGNISKLSNLGGHITQYLVFLQELRLCEQQLKISQKQITNFCFSVHFQWITPFCFKYFPLYCGNNEIFDACSAQSSYNSNFLRFFYNSTAFL